MFSVRLPLPCYSTAQGKRQMHLFSQQTMKKSVDMKSRLEEAILGGAKARAEMMRRRQSANMSSVTSLSGKLQTSL